MTVKETKAVRAKREPEWGRTRDDHKFRASLDILARLDYPPVDPDLWSVRERRDFIALMGEISHHSFSEAELEAASKSAAELRERSERLAAPFESIPTGESYSADLPKVMADVVRFTGRKPTGEQLAAIHSMASGAKRTLTVAEVIEKLGLRAAESHHSGGTTTLDLDALSEGDIERLETLLEKGAGKPAGSFAEGRQLRAMQQELAETLREDAVGPAKKRRLFEQPGTVMLPPELFADLNHVDTNQDGVAVRLHLSDVAYLAAVMNAIENRVVGDRAQLDGDTIVCPSDGRFFNRVWVTDPSGLDGMRINDRSIAFASHHPAHTLSRARWLTLEAKSGVWRISYGPRLLKFLEARG